MKKLEFYAKVGKKVFASSRPNLSVSEVYHVLNIAGDVLVKMSGTELLDTLSKWIKKPKVKKPKVKKPK